MPEGGTFEQRLRCYLESLLDYMDEKPGVVRAAFADESVIGSGSDAGSVESSDPSLRERLALALARGLEQGMASGELRDDYDPLLVSHAMVGLIQQVLINGEKRSLDRAAVIENITRFCGRALTRTDAR